MQLRCVVLLPVQAGFSGVMPCQTPAFTATPNPALPVPACPSVQGTGTKCGH